MATIQEAKLHGFSAYLPALSAERTANYEHIYHSNRHRIYSLAFWMTDSESAAEELLGNVFSRAFAAVAEPNAEQLDRILLAEVRELMPVGSLTLECAVATEVLHVRRNVKRVHLERAVVQLPATERMVFLFHDVENYDHARIARTLGITEEESRVGLHQARLRMRELIASLQV